MSDLAVAIGLLLALEGILYALFPEGMKQVMRQALELPPNSLRTGGLIAALIGVGLVWLVRA
jgi:uncharacterized protein YjeT (DUF2065 family)